MSETSRDVVRIRALNKYYGRGKTRNHVLKDVNLRISAGEIVSIIGTSGSGKTTLLNIIGGLDGDFEGVVEIASQNLHGLSDRQLSRLRNRTLGFVFQTFNLLPHVSCLENVMVPAYFSDIPWGRSRERAEELVRLVGLEEKMHERPTELSGGQRQRVAIARAMFNEPSMILCDKPTGSLDRSTTAQILHLFSELQRSQGSTFVVVTHDEKVSRACTRVVRLEDGRVVADDAQEPQLPELSSSEASA